MAWVAKGAYWAVLLVRGTVPLNNLTKLSVESGAMAIPLSPRTSEFALKSREIHREKGFLGPSVSLGKNKEGLRSMFTKKEADLSGALARYNFSSSGGTGLVDLVRTMCSMSICELPRTFWEPLDKWKSSFPPRVYLTILAS